MNKKTALLFVDDEAVKIVYGISLKVVKFADMNLDYNVRFFDKLFEEWNVIVVESVAPLSKQGLLDFVSELQGKPAPPAAQTAPAPKQQQSAMFRSPAQQEPVTKRAMDVEDDCMLFRFIGQSIVCVDDVPTGEDFPGMPGVKQTLVIKPDQAINLSRYDPDKVRNSPILRRLIRRGSLVPCTPEEADDLIIRADQKQKADNDARLDRAARMVPPGMSAEEYADRIRRGATLGPDDDVETIEVTAAAPRAQNNRSVNAAERMLEMQNELTMEQLDYLAGVGIEGDPRMEAEPAPKRQLAQRPTATLSDLTAKSTRRLPDSAVEG